MIMKYWCKKYLEKNEVKKIFALVKNREECHCPMIVPFQRFITCLIQFIINKILL